MRPNAADVVVSAIRAVVAAAPGYPLENYAPNIIEELRAAVGATEGQPVVLLADGTLTVPEDARGALWRELQDIQIALRNEADRYAETAENVTKIRALRSRANGLEVAVVLIQQGDPLWRIPGAES